MRERVIIIIIIINYLAHVPYPPDHHSLWTRLQLAQRLSTAAAKFQLFHEHHTPTTGPINIHRRRLKVTSPLVSSPAHAAFIVRAVSRLSSTNGETWNEAQANTLRPFNPHPPPPPPSPPPPPPPPFQRSCTPAASRFTHGARPSDSTIRWAGASYRKHLIHKAFSLGPGFSAGHTRRSLPLSTVFSSQGSTLAHWPARGIWTDGCGLVE